MVLRRDEAPRTATDRGSKKGRRDATTAVWSRASTREAYLAVGAMGNVISTSPPESALVTSKPTPSKTWIIGELSAITSPMKRSIPCAAARGASCSSSLVPIPRPWYASATANATSALRGSRSRT